MQAQDSRIQITGSRKIIFCVMPGSEFSQGHVLGDKPIRVIIHGHHPHEASGSRSASGKLVFLPETVDELFKLGG